MRKLVLFQIVLFLIVSCKQDINSTKEPIEGKEIEQPESEKKMSADDYEVNQIIQKNSTFLCESDIQIKNHKISKDTFELYRNNKWGVGNQIKNKLIYWADLKHLIGENECFDMFIHFNFDPAKNDNFSIHPSLEDYFTTKKTCFSIPLFKAIEAKNSLNDGDLLEFTIAKDQSKKEFVIFAVINNNDTLKAYEYYDVSHWPTIVKSLVK